MDALLKLARLQAEKVEMVKRHHKTIFRLGAVLFDGKRIINVGRNYANKTHPDSNNPYKTVHAEFDAILGVPRWQLEGASILVVRLNMAGQFVLAKPCEYCDVLIRAANLKEVFWTNNNGGIDHATL